MSVVNPTIDDLLSVTGENRFLLCEMAARRARDINDMMRNQHNRAEQLADVEDVTLFLNDENGHAPNPLSIAFAEIAPKKDEDGAVTGTGDLGYDRRTLSASLGLAFDESEFEEYAVPAEAEVPEASEDAAEAAPSAEEQPAEEDTAEDVVSGLSALILDEPLPSAE